MNQPVNNHLNDWKLALMQACRIKVNALIRSAGPDEILELAPEPELHASGIVTPVYARADLRESGHISVFLEAGKTQALLDPKGAGFEQEVSRRQHALSPGYIDRVLAHVDYSGDRMRALGSLYSLLADAMSKSILFSDMTVMSSHARNRPVSTVTFVGMYKLACDDVTSEYGLLNFPHGYNVPINITYVGHAD